MEARAPKPPWEDPWEYLERIAQHSHRDVHELWAEARLDLAANPLDQLELTSSICIERARLRK